MRLFEAIFDVNRRAAREERTLASPETFSASLPVAVLTCFDPRLNTLLPKVLGVPESELIWLRNAGNVITGPMSSTLRSLSLACVVEGAKEIAVIGHSDCLLCKASLMQLTDDFRSLGVDRERLPENLVEFLNIFASERQNVIKATDFIRQSPLIGPKVPVHGLMLDTETGRLEWIVNGYQMFSGVTAAPALADRSPLENLVLPEFHIGEMKFPEMKIGELATEAKHLVQEGMALAEKAKDLAEKAKSEFRKKATQPLPKPGSTPPPVPGQRKFTLPPRKP